MKRVIILLLFLCFIFPSDFEAQEFAPVGATWVYQNLFPETQIFPVLIRYTSIKDTIVGDWEARKIEKEALSYEGLWDTEGFEIVSSRNDSVFVFYDHEFHLIYDFTREVGDTLIVIDEPFGGFQFNNGGVTSDFSHFKYRIDSIVAFGYGDSMPVSKQYVSYLENPADSIHQWGFQDVIALAQDPPVKGQIISGIGSSGHGSPLGTSAGTTYISDFEIEKLTCYSDLERTIKFSGIDCDSLIASYEAKSSTYKEVSSEVKVFPSPFSSVLNIELPGNNDSIIFIYDIGGSLVAKFMGGKSAYDLSSLRSGMYILKIASQDHINQTFKIQKI